MKASQFLVLFLLALALFTTRSTAVNQLQFDGGRFNLTWSYLSATQEIEFEVRVQSTGYVALGLTKTNSGMQSLDLFAGGVNAGANYLKDYNVNSTTRPTEDAQQNYTLISASESNGITMVHCKRKLITNDTKDFQIQAGDKVYFAWATHPTTDGLTYHYANRGYSSQMYELVPVQANPTTDASNDTSTTAGPTASTKQGPIPTTTATMTSLLTLAFFAALIAP